MFDNRVISNVISSNTFDLIRNPIHLIVKGLRLSIKKQIFSILSKIVLWKHYY